MEDFTKEELIEVIHCLGSIIEGDISNLYIKSGNGFTFKIHSAYEYNSDTDYYKHKITKASFIKNTYKPGEPYQNQIDFQNKFCVEND